MDFRRRRVKTTYALQGDECSEQVRRLNTRKRQFDAKIFSATVSKVVTTHISPFLCRNDLIPCILPLGLTRLLFLVYRSTA